jgi:hypothetical protein
MFTVIYLLIRVAAVTSPFGGFVSISSLTVNVSSL